MASATLPETKHTPGPWAVDPIDKLDVYSAEGLEIAFACDHSLIGGRVAPEAQREANARLIAAAPEMLGALETIAIINPAELDDCDQLALIHAFLAARSIALGAIAKALGGAA